MNVIHIQTFKRWYCCMNKSVEWINNNTLDECIHSHAYTLIYIYIHTTYMDLIIIFFVKEVVYNNLLLFCYAVNV